MGIARNKDKIVSIFLVCLVMINSIVLVFAGVPGAAVTSLETNSEEILIDDFSQFVTRGVSGNVSAVQTSEGVSFWNNNLSVLQAYLSFGLPFDIFGNITDVSLSFDAHYVCSNISGNFMFNVGLASFFEPSTEEYVVPDSYIRTMVMCGIRNWTYFYEGYVGRLFFGDEEFLSDPSLPVENSVTFTITKIDRTVQASIADENGKVLFSFKRNNPHIYAYTSMFYLWYSAFAGTQFTVDISSLNVNLLVEQRDWTVEARNDRIVKSLVILLICLLVLSFIILVVFTITSSRNYRIREEKRIRQEKRANDEKYRKFGE